MSTTTDPAPVPASTPAGLLGNLHATLAVLDHAAASIYHRIAAVETDITQWTTDNPNPVVAGLFQEGIGYATTWLDAFGVPVGPIVAAGSGLMAALKALAAADASMTTVTASKPAP